MALLHTVNKSPFGNNSLERCLSTAKDGSTVLLIEDGVYGATKGTAASAMVEEAMKKVTVCVLKEDAAARGVSDRVMDGIKLVDYAGFVQLAADNSQVQSWL